MRAEAQAHIDQINAATALLRRFLDWDRALKRLDELNAKVEDSTLWDDPKTVSSHWRGSPTAPNATRSRRSSPVRPTPTTPMSRSMPAPAEPRARTGRTCCSACIRAGPSATA
jgi:peptide chain release factor 2